MMINWREAKSIMNKMIGLLSIITFTNLSTMLWPPDLIQEKTWTVTPNWFKIKAPAHGHVSGDSSAVRRLFVRLAGAVVRQSALYMENSGFAAPNLGQHISTFRGCRSIGFYFLSEALI